MIKINQTVIKISRSVHVLSLYQNVTMAPRSSLPVFDIEHVSKERT